MKNLLVFFVFLTLITCNDDNNNNESMSQFNLQNQIFLSFKNSTGQNLFDASTKNSFDINKIRLYYLIDNKPVEVSVKNGYNMGNVELISNNKLKVFTNFDRSNIIKKTTEYNIIENITYLQLSETDTDTIKTHSKMNKGSFVVSKVWYNGKFVWENKGKGELIEILKE